MRAVPISNPPNPWATTEVEYLEAAPAQRLHVYEDHSKSLIASNDSPDVGFKWSVNPYRGCMHACAYCFARPSHEYLSLGAGTDFDTKIHVKTEAPRLLREALNKPSWKGELIVFSGVTDCYQPLEASYRLTRRLLEVCAEFNQPVHLITKAPLIERDLDVLSHLARNAYCGVSVSVPFWNKQNARAMEPYVATPQRRIETVRKLSAAGIPVTVNVAPIIPGLSDEDMTKVVDAAAEAGAVRAVYVLLRLPSSVKDVFEARVREALPLRAERILHRIRETRGGALYDSRFGVRGRGEGLYAEQIHNLFQLAVRRAGLNTGCPGEQQREDNVERFFRRPMKLRPQLELF